MPFEIVGIPRYNYPLLVLGVEMFRKLLDDEGRAGENVVPLITWYKRETRAWSKYWLSLVQSSQYYNSKLKCMYVPKMGGAVILHSSKAIVHQFYFRTN